MQSSYLDGGTRKLVNIVSIDDDGEATYQSFLSYARRSSARLRRLVEKILIINRSAQPSCRSEKGQSCIIILLLLITLSYIIINKTKNKTNHVSPRSRFNFL